MADRGKTKINIRLSITFGDVYAQEFIRSLVWSPKCESASWQASIQIDEQWESDSVSHRRLLSPLQQYGLCLALLSREDCIPFFRRRLVSNSQRDKTEGTHDTDGGEATTPVITALSRRPLRV